MKSESKKSPRNEGLWGDLKPFLKGKNSITKVKKQALNRQSDSVFRRLEHQIFQKPTIQLTLPLTFIKDAGYSKIVASRCLKHLLAWRLIGMVSTPSNNMSKDLNKVFGERVRCKFCGDTNTIKKGKRNNKQRYMCKVCNRYFLDNNHFPRMHSNKEIIRFALDSYFEGLSVRKVSRQLKKIWNVDVHPSTIYRWIQKYSPLVKEFTNQFKVNVQDHEWHNDETVLKVGGKRPFYWDLIDRENKFVLSAFLSGRKRNTKQAYRMYKEAKNKSNGLPDSVYCDGHQSYESPFSRLFGKGGNVGFYNKIGIRSKNNNNAIERFHSTLKDRLKPMRGMQNPQAVLDGFIIHYNFLRPHQSLNGQTPAQAGGIYLPFTDGWGDLIDWATYYKNRRN